MCRWRIVAAWQVAIKEPLNRRLVKALDFKPGTTHPAREMRDGVDVIRSAAARVTNPHQALDERLNMRCKLAGSKPVVRNNSRRVCVGIQRLQPPADSGMMSACCSWRERSSE